MIEVTPLSRVLKLLFFGLIVKPLVLFGLGLNVFHRERLPQRGPAILAANHNSHLDTLVLMSLYPLGQLHRLRPVAAADYFLAKRWLAWFALNVIGIIPLKRERTSARHSLFDDCYRALDAGDILIVFPEGSRGAPEQIGELKRGVHHLLKAREGLAVTPIALHGLGRALPKNEALLVPFNCDVVIGEPLPYTPDAEEFMRQMKNSLQELLRSCITRRGDD
ncbi:MAG: 1-acyl-sn-glycerol-3-phosphate acyltransferase [Pseudomonadales bacterium]|jgi:1-acyl-sn-glycerol-3-phosphate acyltransferase|nr:1-acyl-sn-glycerol-3-phosphate acyltransferase [Pseudomonadales bacterium]